VPRFGNASGTDRPIGYSKRPAEIEVLVVKLAVGLYSAD